MSASDASLAESCPCWSFTQLYHLDPLDLNKKGSEKVGFRAEKDLTPVWLPSYCTGGYAGNTYNVFKSPNGGIAGILWVRTKFLLLTTLPLVKSRRLILLYRNCCFGNGCFIDGLGIVIGSIIVPIP